jgi:hypothetical protein
VSTLDEIVKEIKQELDRGVDIDSIRDNSGEWIENYIPIYNNHIIAEWQEMPSEYDNRGSAELGIPNDISIIALMQLDLYLYYSDLFFVALDSVEKSLEGAI